MCYCGTHLQGRKGNKTMTNFRIKKELVKSRLKDFIFEDEFESIKDKEAFYSEVALSFTKNLSENDNLEEALGSAIFSKLVKYMENKEKTESNCLPLQQHICYEYTLHEEDNEWVVLVVQKLMRLELTLCNRASNARYWVATRDIAEIPDKQVLLEFIKANISEWIKIWKNRCIGEVIAHDC